MEIKIEWSELSSKQLNDIYDYYSLKVNLFDQKPLLNRFPTNLFSNRTFLKGQQCHE
jgi:hypothetical protein